MSKHPVFRELDPDPPPPYDDHDKLLNLLKTDECMNINPAMKEEGVPSPTKS